MLNNSHLTSSLQSNFPTTQTTGAIDKRRTFFCSFVATLVLQNVEWSGFLAQKNNAIDKEQGASRAVVFLAALSSSRSLVVGRSVGPSVGPSKTFVKK